VICDPNANEATVKRVVLLSGKIYYDLVKERQARGLDDSVAFIRIEELSPFPFAELRQVLARYGHVKEFFWLQEEARNQGAYAHVWNRIDSVLARMRHDARVVYKGRKESALPATGIGKIYSAEQRTVINAAFEGL
jgi:probable 2-oxoglutarate dehydrogenase E1 component DHKTD1